MIKQCLQCGHDYEVEEESAHMSSICDYCYWMQTVEKEQIEAIKEINKRGIPRKLIAEALAIPNNWLVRMSGSDEDTGI